MSRYGYDPARRALIVSWATGTGDLAATVAVLPPATTDSDALRLAEQLSFLTAAAWRTYTHPASATPSLATGSEGWRRHSDRQAFTSVLTAIRHPQLPHNGTQRQSYVIVHEAAHRVGRALHAIGSQDLTEKITTDVRAELDAIEQAECGDLTGRARQAITLTRADASPVQVAAADAILADDPFGNTRLCTDIDPAAAATAAAHWLHAAATVAAHHTGLDPTQILIEADNIEALPHESPTVVLERMGTGETPRDVVLQLITDAMAVAEGAIPDLDTLLAAIDAAHERADSFEDQPDELRHTLMPPRLTPLDPARPATDLLEDLLAGIHGCWLLYREYTESPDADPDAGCTDEADDDNPTGAPGAPDEERITTTFLDQVRAAAAARRSELL
ncbi:hypothetical protein [Frankia sp. Cr2]|uniref:hypothetical protein n=1 Tax=Frankia sp. Cr2 TaxID=3073932 RepID=UPI002AD39FF7|nr:hypothetical protein [Frankia sp. Cr2]